jgi:hypothetical protein
LIGLFPIIHITIGIMMITGRIANSPPNVGFVFVGVGAMMIMLFWGIAGCLIISGRFLNQRRHYMFSFVVAAISCLQVPFGTLLGIFTIIVLSRQSVKAIYGRQ